MSEDTDDGFRTAVETGFRDRFDASDDVAERAAELVTAFREEFDLDLSAEAFLDAVADADYDAFDHRYDQAIGDLAADVADCTDSREYRLAGFDDLAADPDIGA
jgi:hypothetical protein